MNTLRRITVGAGVTFLALAFLAVGVSKLAGTSAVRWAERFEQWGYPAYMHYAIGVVEIIGGLGMLIPRWRRAASLALAVVMAGALVTHAVHGEWPRVLPPLVLGGLALLGFRSANHSGARQL